MENRIRFLLLCSLAILLPAALQAQAPAQADTAASPSSTHFTAQAQFSFMNQTGNVEGTTLSGGLTAVVWSGNFANTFQYTGNIQRLETGGNKSDYAIHILQDLFRLNITGDLFGVAAVDWERNDPKLIESRFSYHLGLGYDILATPGHSLGFIAAVGRTSETTTVPITNLVDDYTTLYFADKYAYQVTESLSLSQSLDFFAPIDDLSGYRARLSLAINSTIYKRIGLSIKFDLNYDNNPHTPAAVLQPERDKLDTSQTVALTVQI